MHDEREERYSGPRDPGSSGRRPSPRWEDRGRDAYRSRKDDDFSKPATRSPTSYADPDMRHGRSQYGDSRGGSWRNDRSDRGRRYDYSSDRRHDQLHYDEPDVDEEEQRAGGSGRGDWRNSARGRRGDRSRSRSRQRRSGRSPEPYHPRRYRSRSRSPRYDYADSHGHSHSYARGAHHQPKASSTLILENLPADVTEKDIALGLDELLGGSHMSSDQAIRGVRVRSNKKGGRIAFVEFWHLADASDFFDRFYPSFALRLLHSRGPDSEPATVTINYSRPREDAADRFDPRADDGDWECYECGALNYPHRAVCFKCRAERPDDFEAGNQGRPGMFSAGSLILTGETDECPQQTPSQFVVIRDLEPSVTEEVLAKGVAKLFVDSEPAPAAREARSTPNKLKSTAPVHGTAGLGATPGSLRRVFLMRDRRSSESWRYGFAEFATVEDAKGAVAKFRASAKFTIASKPVVVAFIHAGVFVPALDDGSGGGGGHPETSKFTFAPIYNPSVRVKYWDDRAYPSELVVSTGPDPSPSVSKKEDPRGTAGGAKRKTAPSAASKSGPSAPQDGPGKRSKRDKEAAAGKATTTLVMAPQMQLWAKKAAELHGEAERAAEDASEAPSALATAQSGSAETDRSLAGWLVDDVSDSTDPVDPHPSDQYVSYADWDALECLLCGTFKSDEWLTYHELHAHDAYRDEETRARAARLLQTRGKEPRTVVRRVPRRRCDPLPIYTSYADQEKLVCYLCARRFRNVQVLRLHERESELHRRNLADPARIDKAVGDLAKVGWKPARMFPLGYEGPARSLPKKYRDRAQERRQVFKQPIRPSAAQQQQQQQQQQQGPDGGSGEDTSAKKASKGAGLLAKMGWTEGAGLGRAGEGRTEAVATELYAPGVGLGAEGSKLGDAAEEAARKTRGKYSDFLEKTRDKARERFEKLGP